jgi:hypothetical protein
MPAGAPLVAPTSDRNKMKAMSRRAANRDSGDFGVGRNPMIRPPSNVAKTPKPPRKLRL